MFMFLSLISTALSVFFNLFFFFLQSTFINNNDDDDDDDDDDYYYIIIIIKSLLSFKLIQKHSHSDFKLIPQIDLFPFPLTNTSHK